MATKSFSVLCALQQVSSSLSNWPWQTAYTYVWCLGRVSIDAASSHIAKRAMDGDGGLGQLVRFENAAVGWVVRCGCVEGLAWICERTRDDATRDGLHSVAWSHLMERDVSEPDSRVLEGMKMGKVGPDRLSFISSFSYLVRR